MVVMAVAMKVVEDLELQEGNAGGGGGSGGGGASVDIVMEKLL